MTTGSGNPERPLALVAEDSAIQLCELEILLEQSGIAIASAATLTTLRALIESRSPDVAVLDVNLDKEVVFPLADVLIKRGVPIVFLTGCTPKYTFPEHLLGLPILTKPYDPAELKQEIVNAIFSARAQSDDESQENRLY